MGHPNWLRIEVELVMAAIDELARAHQMTHAKVATKVNDKGELVIAMVLPSNYAKAFGQPREYPS